MLFWGMLIQALALFTMTFSDTFNQFVGLSALLGIGTAVVYPTFLAAMANFTHPEQRAQSIGVFRLWRDLGYAIGALATGIVADIFDINTSILMVGLLTAVSAFIIMVRMKDRNEAIAKII